MEPRLDPERRTWHITFGTYATRLHSDGSATVTRDQNQRGTPFPVGNPDQHEAGHPPVVLTPEQRRHVERVVPAVCERGKWTLRVAAAPPEGDHVHVLLDAAKNRQPKDIRKWLKRWLGESLSEAFGRPAGGWWATGGSTRPVTDERYLRNVTGYVARQRTTRG